MIEFNQRGNFDKSVKFLNFIYRRDFMKHLDGLAIEGQNALESATPIDTGLTARSWYYDIKTTRNQIKISWYNSNLTNGVPVAILVQYGHATETGYWVEGKDFINPAIRPVFDRIAEQVWGEVTNA